MEYKPLSELQNTYPGDENSVSGSYTSKNDTVKFQGIYPDNFLMFEILKLDDINIGEINIAENTNFRFIVKFVNDDGDDEEGSLWTSQPFLNDLEQLIKDNNPYTNRNTVTTANVDFEVLSRYYLKDELVGLINEEGTEYIYYGETYAEVRITETIDTKKDILKHIDWMVSPDPDLRKVDDFGAWIVETTPSLGFLPETDETGSAYLQERLGAVESRNDGSGGLRDVIGNVTGSPVPEGRERDTTTGSGGLREPVISTSTESSRGGFFRRIFGR